MLEYFTQGFQTLAKSFPAAAVIAANALLLAFFALFLFLKNKRPYFYFACAFTALECAFLCGAGMFEEAALYTALSFAIGCLLTGFLRFQKTEKKSKDDAPVREYVRNLAKKLDTPAPEPRKREEEPKFSSDADVKKSLSLAHARSVIERLHYFNLSAPDRNRLSELEYSLSSMERGDVPLATVNEKLSYLIKMLAKYGA
ncbi:MAG: hypothetical protein DBX59_03130 [Bacillota bacterium]|nr:MAG: hypothetical protein DBX59_03130 [Bacillota bacterium]